MKLLRALLLTFSATLASFAFGQYSPAVPQYDYQQYPQQDPSGVFYPYSYPYAYNGLLSKTRPIDLSTVDGNGWTVNGYPAVTQTVLSAQWDLPTSFANWISATPNASTYGLAPGLYVYRLDFFVPRCSVAHQLFIAGNYGGDNRVKISIQANYRQPIASCVGFGTCANSRAPPRPFNVALHTRTNWPAHYRSIVVEVENAGMKPSPSGLFVNAQVSSTCPPQYSFWQ